MTIQSDADRIKTHLNALGIRGFTVEPAPVQYYLIWPHSVNSLMPHFGSAPVRAIFAEAGRYGECTFRVTLHGSQPPADPPAPEYPRLLQSAAALQDENRKLVETVADYQEQVQQLQAQLRQAEARITDLETNGTPAQRIADGVAQMITAHRKAQGTPVIRVGGTPKRVGAEYAAAMLTSDFVAEEIRGKKSE